MKRLGLVGNDRTDYQFTLKFFDNDLSMEENCAKLIPKGKSISDTIMLFRNNDLDFNKMINEGQLIITKKSLPNNKYSSEYWKCVTNNVVAEIEQKQENEINISFVNTTLKLRLIADVECSDISWFQCENVNSIIGKEIKYVYNSNYHVSLPKSDRD